MTQIEEANLYQSCAWQKDSANVGSIFSRDVLSCSNRTNFFFELSCIEANNIITATATFVSPMQKDDGGVYQVQCRFTNLSEVVVAEITFMISGIN